MATVLQHLADELVKAVFSHLKKEDLKSARVTCVRWSRIGAETLFQRVYFAPRQDTMELFQNISSHPIFSRNITEIIYDSRLYLPAYSDVPRFKERYTSMVEPCLGLDHDPEIEEMVDDQGTTQLAGRSKEVYDRYIRLLSEQEDVFSHGKDFRTLCDGLQRMPNLSSISLEDDFHECGLPFEEASDSWYSDRTWTAPYTEGWRHYFELDDEANTAGSDHFEWDFRGINHLFSAMSQHCASIKSVRIGSLLSSAPFQVMKPDSASVRYLTNVASDLLDLRISCDHPEARDTSSVRAEYVSGLVSVMARARHLETLSLNTTLSLSQIGATDFNQCCLKTLVLGWTAVSEEDFISLVKGSCNTLRSLYLRHTTLVGGQTWQPLASWCGHSLRLHHIEVLGLPALKEKSYKEVEALAKLFVGWADPQALQIEPEVSTKAVITVDPDRLIHLQHQEAAGQN